MASIYDRGRLSAVEVLEDSGAGALCLCAVGPKPGGARLAVGHASASGLEFWRAVKIADPWGSAKSM